MVATDINADHNDPNHTAALERHTIARMEVTNLVSQMQETLSTIHQTISSLDTAEHDARLDALEQDRDKHIQAIQTAFADESSAINQKRKAERDEILERRRREDEERERRRKLEDEEMEAKARMEDEERDKDLRIHTQEVEDKTDALMAQVEEEATRMLAEAGDKLKVLEERRKEINRRLDEQLQMPLPPPPSRTRRTARAAGNNTEAKSVPWQTEAVESKRLEPLPVEAVNAQPMSNPPVKAHEDDTDAESVSDEHHALSRQSSTETLPPTTYSPDPADLTLSVPGLNITAHKEAEEGENNALGVMTSSHSPHHDQDEDMDAALAEMPQLSRVNSRDPSAETHTEAQVDAVDGDAHVADPHDGKQEKTSGHSRSLTAELAWWEEQQKNGMNIPGIVGEVSEDGEGHGALADGSMPLTFERPVSRRPSLAGGEAPVAALDLSEVTKGLAAFDKDALPAPLERHGSDISRRPSLAAEESSVAVHEVDGGSRRSSFGPGELSVVARDVARDIAEGHKNEHHEVSLEEVDNDRAVAHADEITEEEDGAGLRGHIEPHASPEPGIREAGSFSPRAPGEDRDWPLRHDDFPTPDTQDRRDSLTTELTLDSAIVHNAADTVQHSSPITEQHAQVEPAVTSPSSTADNNFQTASVETPVSHIEFMSKQVHDELDMVEASPVDVVSIGSPSERDSFDGAHDRSQLTADSSVANVDEHSQGGDKDDVASEAGSVSAADEHAVARALPEDSQLQPMEVTASSVAEHGGLDANDPSIHVHDDRDSISGDEHLEPMSKSLSEEVQQDDTSEDPETLFDDDPLAERSPDDTAMAEKAVEDATAHFQAERSGHELADGLQVAQLLHDQQDLGAVSRAVSEVGDHDDLMSEDELPLGKVESRSLADELGTEDMRDEQSDYEDDERNEDDEKEPITQGNPEHATAVPVDAPILSVVSESETLDHETSSLEEQPSAPAQKEGGLDSDDKQGHEAHPSVMADSHDAPASPTDSNLRHSQASHIHDHDTVHVPTQVSGPASEYEDSDNEADDRRPEGVQPIEPSPQVQKVDEAGPDDESTLPLPTGLTDAESPAFFTPLESTGLRSSYMTGKLHEEHAHDHDAPLQLDGPTDGAPYDGETKAQLDQADDDLHEHHMPATGETSVLGDQLAEADMSDTEVTKLAEPDIATETRRPSVTESVDQDHDMDIDEQVAGNNMLKRVATDETFEQDSNAGYESPHHKVELEHRYSATVHGQDYLFDDDNQSRDEDDDDGDSVSDGVGKDVPDSEHVKGSLHAEQDKPSGDDGQLDEAGKHASRVDAASPVLESSLQHGQQGHADNEDEPAASDAALALAVTVDEQPSSKSMDHVAEEADSTVSPSLVHSHNLHDTEETIGRHDQGDQDSEHEARSAAIAAFPLPPSMPTEEDEDIRHQTELAEPVSPTSTRGLAASRHNPERPQTPETEAQHEDTLAHELSLDEPCSSPNQNQAIAEAANREPIEAERDAGTDNFTPRDVTNISWSESHQEQPQHEEQQSRLRSQTNQTDMSYSTAPELDVESTPMSMRSVSTISSAPSSPVHAALLGDNHEPVIRDSWPNPASGRLNSFMGASSTGRARGESNLSNVSYSEDYVDTSNPKVNSGFGGLAPSPMRLWQRREQSHHLSTDEGEEYTGAGYQVQRPVSAMDLSHHHTSDSTLKQDRSVTPTTATYRNSVPAASSGAGSGPASGGGASSLFQRMRSVFENNSSSTASATAAAGSRGSPPTVRSRPGSWYSRASAGAATDQTQKTEPAAYDDAYDGQDGGRGTTTTQAEADKSSWYHENSRRRESRRGYDDLDVSDEDDSGEENASLLSAEENGHSYDDERGYHRYDRHGRLTAN